MTLLRQFLRDGRHSSQKVGEPRINLEEQVVRLGNLIAKVDIYGIYFAI